MSINKFNSEGYYDPTAYEAMTAVEKEERALRAFRPIVYICSPYALSLIHICYPLQNRLSADAQVFLHFFQSRPLFNNHVVISHLSSS